MLKKPMYRSSSTLSLAYRWRWNAVQNCSNHRCRGQTAQQTTFVGLIPAIDSKRMKRLLIAQVSGRLVMNELSIMFQFSRSFCF